MKEAIILFTRVPIPGHTKTRLQVFFSPKECARLHTCFLMDLRTCCEQIGKDCFAFYTPEGEGAQLVPILGENLPYFSQQGDNLGARMYNAISTVIDLGYDSCILIGTDIPQIQPQDLEAAFAILKDKDIVLGPTVDKGYYLVGMKKPQAAVFENQTYGYGSVLENTIEAIRSAELTYGLIRTYEDIDEPKDVLNYQNKVERQELCSKTYTAEYIAEFIEVYQEKWNELKA